MGPPVSADESVDLHYAIELMLSHHARQLIVTNEHGAIVGFVDEADITRAYLAELTTADPGS